MKVVDCSNFNQEFPEAFPWGHVDSPKLSSLGSIIATRVMHSFRTDPNRIEVPGLRAALNEMAKISDC